MNNKRRYNTIVSQAKQNVTGFGAAYSKFIERVSIDQSSKSMIINYSRSIAAVALHFNRVPHQISVEEINSYLYRMTAHEKQSISYFKQAVYGLRHWFRLLGMEEKAMWKSSKFRLYIIGWKKWNCRGRKIYKKHVQTKILPTPSMRGT